MMNTTAIRNNKSPLNPSDHHVDNRKLTRRSSSTSLVSTANDSYSLYTVSATRGGTEKKVNGALRHYLKRCIDELSVETPNLWYAGRRSTKLLDLILQVVYYSDEDDAGRNNKAKKNQNDIPLLGDDIDLAKQFAVQLGAIEQITRLMRKFKDLPRYQSKAVELLGVLGHNNPDHQDEIAKYHGVSYICGVLLHPQHSKNERLCARACEALARICSKYSKPALSQLIDTCDGIFTICGLIKKKYLSEKYAAAIHKNVLKLLVNAASYYEFEPYWDADEAFEDKEKVGFTFSDNEPIRLGQTTVSNGKTYPFLQHVVDPDIVDDIMNSLIVKHFYKKKASEKILEQSIHLIHILATQGRHFGTRNALVRKNAIPVVLKGMQCYKGLLPTECLQVQMKGLDTLFWFAKERVDARETILQDGCATIMDAMVLSHRWSDRLFPFNGLLGQKTVMLGPTTLEMKSVDIPQRACQLFDVLLRDDTKCSRASANIRCIAKNLNENPKAHEVLKDLKEKFPQECGASIDTLIAAYNQIYCF